MNVMVCHKMPLSAHSSILRWGKRSVSDNGFVFSHISIRKRNSIFKEIGQHLGWNDDQFIPMCINWLPDDRPIQVYIRSSKNALYALLFNTHWMKEENLSFPDSRTHMSPHQS